MAHGEDVYPYLQPVTSENNAFDAYLASTANGSRVKTMRAMLAWPFVVTIPLGCSTRRELEQGDCRLLGPAGRMWVTLWYATGTRRLGTAGPP